MKNFEKADFNQCLESAAPKNWSKNTTQRFSNCEDLFFVCFFLQSNIKALHRYNKNGNEMLSLSLSLSPSLSQHLSVFYKKMRGIFFQIKRVNTTSEWSDGKKGEKRNNDGSPLFFSIFLLFIFNFFLYHFLQNTHTHKHSHTHKHTHTHTHTVYICFQKYTFPFCNNATISIEHFH